MIHGGAFVGYSVHPNHTFGSMYRQLVSTHPSIRRGLAVEYRLSTGPPLEHANPFPAALLDILAGYAYLTDVVGFAPGDIVVVGNSSGGNLAIALVRYILENRTEKNHIPDIPRGLILVSPWVDLGESHDYPDGSHHTCQNSDYVPIYCSPLLIWARKQYCSVVGYPEATNTNRYISPASTDHEMEPVSFKGFPQTFVLYGDAEMLYDQVCTLREKMAEDIGCDRVHYHVVKDGVHNILAVPFFESGCQNAFAAVGRWLAKILKEGKMSCFLSFFASSYLF